MNVPATSQDTPKRRPGDPLPPPGYVLVRERRFFGSVVRAEWRGPRGDVLEWTSRGHRKGRTPVVRPAGQIAAEAPVAGPAGGTARRRPPVFGFAIRDLTWWVAVAFTAGSVFFVVGAAGAVGDPASWWPNPMYFAGSVLFTIGASLQMAETARAGRDVGGGVGEQGERRLLILRRGRLDWNASVIQLVGTVLFNINCFWGMSMSLSHQQEDARVWVPSTVASVCFVAASWLSLFEANGAWWAWRPRRLEWWITMGSLLGSWGFLLSSLAGFFLGGHLESLVTGVLGPHGETLWLEYAVDGMLLAGSIAFLIGSYPMIPEALRADRREAGAPRGPT
jgi:hypothetical protein